MSRLSRIYPELLDDATLAKLKVDHPKDYRSKDERAKNPYRLDSDATRKHEIAAANIPETNGAPI